MKQITAKFNSKCSQTGQPLKKGQQIYFDIVTRRAYSLDAPIVKAYREQQSTSDYIQANEDAYFDNFCQNNNI